MKIDTSAPMELGMAVREEGYQRIVDLALHAVHWVFFFKTLCFLVCKRQKETQVAPISILASMLLGRV